MTHETDANNALARTQSRAETTRQWARVLARPPRTRHPHPGILARVLRALWRVL